MIIFTKLDKVFYLYLVLAVQIELCEHCKSKIYSLHVCFLEFNLSFKYHS